MKTLLVAVVAWFAVSGSLDAQQSYCEVDCKVRVGQAFTVFTEHVDGSSGWRLVMNGQHTAIPFVTLNGMSNLRSSGGSIAAPTRST